MENLFGALFFLQILFAIVQKCISTPTPFWCPTGRYPTDNGQCRLCYEQCGSEGFLSTLTPFWCPTGRYPTDNDQCRLCYEQCGSEGCTGPGSNLGPGGCSSCWLSLEVTHSDYVCMSPFAECPSDHYRKVETTDGHTRAVCKRCHPLCRTCTGPTVSHCETCKFFRWDGLCVRACPPGAIVRSRRRACVVGTHHRNRGYPAYLLPYRNRHWNRHHP